MSTDSTLSSRTNSGATDAARKLSQEMRKDHWFYDPVMDTWVGGAFSGPYTAGYSDKSNGHGGKVHHSRNVKRPSRSNIFNLNDTASGNANMGGKGNSSSKKA